MTRFCVLMSVLLSATALATADELTFFGQDAGQGESAPLATHPNADAARNDFLSQLTAIGTEDFEGFANGQGTQPTPLSLNFQGAGITATLSDTGVGYVNQVPAGDSYYGRYPISGDQYWETGDAFQIDFSAPIAAFGFYGTDIGDHGGQITLSLYLNGVLQTTLIPPTPVAVSSDGGLNYTGVADGDVVYYGFTDTDTFNSIVVGDTAPFVDYFGFDDFSVGSLPQVPDQGAVPEPSSILLLGIFLCAVAGLRRFCYTR